ncbi:MAG: TetR/AcrR family transcriptional regulator [Planctomycetota bacterium]
MNRRPRINSAAALYFSVKYNQSHDSATSHSIWSNVIAKKIRSTAAQTRQRIMESAKHLFLEQGYGKTNLDHVASEAGVTKPTVYSHFGSKDGLLLAITEAHAGPKAAAMSSTLASSGDVREDLMRFGEVFMQRVVGEEAGCWHRLAIAESKDHPEIGRSIFNAGPARVISAMKDFVSHEMKKGRLKKADAAVAAEQFLGLLIGLQPIRMMTGQKPPNSAKRKKLCAAAVDTFLAAYGVES